MSPARLDEADPGVREMGNRGPQEVPRRNEVGVEHGDELATRGAQPCLEGAGASLDSVVKAQVYLSDPEDVPGFNEVWLKHFKNAPPATTIIATANPGFAIHDLRIEINTISLATKGKTRREVTGWTAQATITRTASVATAGTAATAASVRHAIATVARASTVRVPSANGW